MFNKTMPNGTTMVEKVAAKLIDDLQSQKMKPLQNVQKDLQRQQSINDLLRSTKKAATYRDRKQSQSISNYMISGLDMTSYSKQGKRLDYHEF